MMVVSAAVVEIKKLECAFLAMRQCTKNHLEQKTIAMLELVNMYQVVYEINKFSVAGFLFRPNTFETLQS